MHWAAAHGHLDIVRRLADAGGDVVGRGDDHALEVIGWATCFDECHGDVADLLVHRGARHHIFSAIAMNLAAEVRRIVAADPAAVYATAPAIDRRVLETIRARSGTKDLFTALALEDWDAAERFESRGGDDGVLHLMSKRGHLPAVKWLLDHHLAPNARWWHWDAQVTPLHLASAHGHAEIVRLLLDAGADPNIRDSKHDGDALGWATHFGQREIVRILQASGWNPATSR